jgi:hypothetical protein
MNKDTIQVVPQPVPEIITEPGPRYQDANRRFANVTTITKTPGGRLWCGFSGGGDGEGHLELRYGGLQR